MNPQGSIEKGVIVEKYIGHFFFCCFHACCSASFQHALDITEDHLAVYILGSLRNNIEQLSGGTFSCLCIFQSYRSCRRMNERLRQAVLIW